MQKTDLKVAHEVNGSPTAFGQRQNRLKTKLTTRTTAIKRNCYELQDGNEMRMKLSN